MSGCILAGRDRDRPGAGHLRPTDDDHRVTTLELLFDLVFVYAITNVTHLMEEHVGAEAVLEGIVTLAIVWFGW